MEIFYSGYDDFRSGNFCKLVSEFRRLLVLANEVVDLNLGRKVITGLICDVDDEGRLVFRKPPV